MAATLGSTLLGFLREVINAKYYGTQWQMDTFLAAATIPTILFGLFNGALVTALVPVFSEYLAREDEAQAWRLANTIVNLLGILLIALATIGWLAAPYYVPIIAHGFGPQQMHLTVQMTRMLMPTIVAVSLSGVISAMLNAYHRFRSTALVGIALNIATIVCVVWLNTRLGIYALVVGTLVGLFFQLAVQLPAFLSLRRFRFEIDIHHPGLQRLWMVLGPIIVGSAAGQIALFFDRFFASTLPPGYIAGMNYVTKLVNFPQQVFAAAIATVIFPLLASQFASENRAGVRRSVVLGLRLVNFIAIPAVCALMALATPMVSALFQRGNFGPEATALTASLLPYSAIGLLALGANVVLTRCCFACKETSWTVTISVFAVLVNVVLSLIWLPTLGARGLLLANSVSQTMQTLLLFWLAWRLVGGLQLRKLANSSIRIIGASILMMMSLHWIGALGVHTEPSFASRAWYLVGQIAIGGMVFIGASFLFRVEELQLATRFILEKFERNVLAPPENRSAPIA